MDKLPRTSGVYAIICAATGKAYVGSTSNLRYRWKDHRGKLRHNKHPNTSLQAAWDEHGESAFTFTVLELCERALLSEREQHYFDALRPFDERGFNVGLYADSPMRGRVHTTETRAKIRAAKANITPETRAKMSAAQKGRKAPCVIASNIARAKAYIVTSPDGTQLHVVNLAEFCRAHGLDQASMCHVMTGRQTHHKGWRCEHADEKQGGA